MFWSSGPRSCRGSSTTPTGPHASSSATAPGRPCSCPGKSPACMPRSSNATADAAARLLEKTGHSADDVDLLVPHQANARIIKAVAERLKFPMEKVFVDLEEVGNTSAASIPIALDHAWRAGRLRPGQLVLSVAFGAGLACGANL